jgi:hypothetical protein
MYELRGYMLMVEGKQIIEILNAVRILLVTDCVTHVPHLWTAIVGAWKCKHGWRRWSEGLEYSAPHWKLFCNAVSRSSACKNTKVLVYGPISKPRSYKWQEEHAGLVWQHTAFCRCVSRLTELIFISTQQPFLSAASDDFEWLLPSFCIV